MKMTPINYFEETTNAQINNKTQEFGLFEKLYNAFITPINKEDIFELYLISVEAKKNGYDRVNEIVDRICHQRSVKDIEKMLARCYATADEKEEMLLRRICRVLLKNC